MFRVLQIFFFLSQVMILEAEVPELSSDEDILTFSRFYFREVPYQPGVRITDAPQEQRYLYDGGVLPKSGTRDIREFVFSTSFRISPTCRDSDLSLYIGPTNYPAEIYLNGILVHKIGLYKKAYNSMTYKSQSVFFSPGLLRYGEEENILTVQAFPTYETHALFRMYVSGYRKVEKQVYLYSFLNYYFIQGSVILSVFLCFFFGLLYIKGNFKEKIYLYFSLTDYFYCFSYCNMSFDASASNEVLTEIISRASFPFLACMLLFFFMEYTKTLHRNRVFKPVLLGLSIVMGLITVFQKDKFGVERIFLYTRNFLVTPILLFVLAMLLFASLKKRNTNIKFIFIATLIQTIFGLHDSIKINLHRVPQVWLIPYGYIFLIISIFIVLAVEQSQMYFRLNRQKIDLAMVRNEVALRKESEQKLKEAVKAADAASNAKSMFLANMSHEIRTPLNAILGYSELIFRGEYPEEHSRYASVLHRESQHLTQLVNKILDISKIESGKLNIDITSFRLPEIIKSVEELFSGRCSSKGIEFRLQIEEGVPDVIQSDRVRIQQILVNLLDNALKFTETGYIQLRIWQDKALFFGVSDTGIGIESGKLASIFDNFVQADSSTTRKYGGTGLGITISRQLARLLGGDLSVSSTMGKGSEFTFYLPLQVETAESREEDSGEHGEIPDFSEFRLLLVEDNKTNQEVVRLNLRKTGIEIITADNGEEGIRIFDECCPDIVLMDVQMPVLDGYQATRRIRMKSGAGLIPIIGLTANVFEKDRSLCKSAGMDDVLIKPVKRKDLFDLLSAHLEKALLTGSCCAPDPVRLKQELDVDRQTAMILISGFAGEARQGLRSLTQAMADGDWKTAHREAHSIKGGALNIHADIIFLHARKAEFFCLERNEKKVKIIIRHLQESLDSLENSLQNAKTEG